MPPQTSPLARGQVEVSEPRRTVRDAFRPVLASWRGLREGILVNLRMPAGVMGRGLSKPACDRVAEEERRLTNQFRVHVGEDAIKITRDAERHRLGQVQRRGQPGGENCNWRANNVNNGLNEQFLTCEAAYQVVSTVGEVLGQGEVFRLLWRQWSGSRNHGPKNAATKPRWCAIFVLHSPPEGLWQRPVSREGKSHGLRAIMTV